MSDLSSKMKPGCQRRRYLVDRQLQLKPILILLGLEGLLAVISGGATYLVAKHLLEKQLYSPHIAYRSTGELLLPYLGWINAGFAFILVVGAFFLVHFYLRRTAASLGRLRAHLDCLRLDVQLPGPIHFRRFDPLEPVTVFANRFTGAVGKQRLAARRELDQALRCLENAGEELYRGDMPVDSLRQAASSLADAGDILERPVR